MSAFGRTCMCIRVYWCFACDVKHQYTRTHIYVPTQATGCMTMRCAQICARRIARVNIGQCLRFWFYNADGSHRTSWMHPPTSVSCQTFSRWSWWRLSRECVLRIPSVIVKGAVCRNHRIKRGGPVSVLGRSRLKNPTKCLWRWESNFFSPPAYLCAVTYMTEISLIVTFNNQFTLPYLLVDGRTCLLIFKDWRSLFCLH